MLNRLPIAARLHLTTLVAVLGLVALAGMEIAARMQEAEADRTAILRHVVEAAAAIAAGQQAEEAAGRLSRTEAQGRAIEAIRAIRYRGQEYVWINDMAPVMVMHPFRPELEGRPLGEVRDPSGFRLFLGFVAAVRATGSGTVGYLWPRPGDDQPVEKISYVQRFAPWDWVLGSGIYVDDLRALQHAILLKGSAVALAAALVVALLAWVIARSIVGPLGIATRATVTLAGGDLDTPVPGTDRRDELGILARALETFRAEGLEKRRMVAEAARQEQVRDRRRLAMVQHTQDFGASISGVMGRLGHAADAMRQAAGEVASGIEGTRDGTAETLAGAEASAQNLAAVAAATEQLTSSVTEVAQQVGHAAKASADAVTEAGGMERSIASLSEVTARIGGVVRLISEVAGQTNLLALNATIEAARAGEAGKGFAVVASEVKALAGQTAAATEEIGRHIATIQAATEQAVAAMRTVGGAIGRVDGVSAAITAAVEQQAAATRQIARQVQAVSRQTEVATASLARVATAAEAAGATGGVARTAAADVARVAQTLQGEVDHFLIAMRQVGNSRRHYERLPGGNAAATLRLGGRELPARLQDISRGGAALLATVPPGAAPGDEASLTLAEVGRPVPARVVRTFTGGLALVFLEDAETQAVLDGVIARLEAAGHAPAAAAAVA
ncbi:cache domain-containing protein [Paeniroseomonas aquatica]|uniref:Cache domain-containing protein n=1 Tax=Paeniroseomonas aquatica TaxID=373043 RepID=A0ABT8A5I4_9PROT|nr:cache domain-containing protein [Paeniroseomonas aquatica]MDN3564920.1 cache domain-containing protein [Paeniroseomonas aquatica]